MYGSPQPSPAIASPFDPDKILNLTTYLAVVDKDHNMVSLTSSLLSGFGSGMVVGGAGFFLNDRMRLFLAGPRERELAAAAQARPADDQPGAGAQGRQAALAFGTPAPTRNRRRSSSSF